MFPKRVGKVGANRTQYLHKDIYGREKGVADVDAKQMVDGVWDYVFGRADLTDATLEDSKIPRKTLESMRRSFEYFYPLDIRVSGRDLIPNHLTVSWSIPCASSD